jgi:hypothetical protein
VQETKDPKLAVREVLDETVADSLARTVRNETHTMIWNATLSPQWICFVELSQFIKSADGKST